MIDAHHHLWTIRPRSHPWLAGDPLGRSLTPADYDATFAHDAVAATVWIEALAADPMAELAEADAMRRASGGRIGAALIGHVPLDAADVGARLDACGAISPAFRGVRDILDPRHARAADLLTRPGFLDGLRALAARDLVFDMMLTPSQMRPAAALLAQVPGLRVAVEHVGSPHDRSAAGLTLWKDGLASLAALPRCIVKVSALQCLEPHWTDATLTGIVAVVRDLFTPTRMCVGTDWPVHDRTCPGPEAIAALRRITAAWPARDRQALFTDTARDFYRIDQTDDPAATPTH